METTKSKTIDLGSSTLKMTGNWETQSNHLKGKFSTLTDADLKFEPGKESELLGRMESRLNKSREEVIAIIHKGQPENGQPEKVQPANGHSEKVQPEKPQFSTRSL